MTKSNEDIKTKLKFNSFSRFQFGKGFVTFEQSDEDKINGRYDPHILFVHDNFKSDDMKEQEQVEEDCRELARLFNKFAIANVFVTDKVIKCGKGKE